MSFTGLKRTAIAFAGQQDEEALLGSPTALWKTALRRLFRRKTGIVGMILVGAMAFIALAAPVLAPYDPYDVLIGKEAVKKRSPPAFTCSAATHRSPSISWAPTATCATS